MDKITTIAELKTAIDDRRWRYEAEGRSAIGSILKLISEFEASVRKRAELLAASANNHMGRGPENLEIAVRLDFQCKELREILGESLDGELCKNCGHKIKQYDAHSVKIENIVQERNLLKHNLWGHQVGDSVLIRERCECDCLKPQPKLEIVEAGG